MHTECNFYNVSALKCDGRLIFNILLLKLHAKTGRHRFQPGFQYGWFIKLPRTSQTFLQKILSCNIRLKLISKSIISKSVNNVRVKLYLYFTYVLELPVTFQDKFSFLKSKSRFSYYFKLVKHNIKIRT